WFLTEDIRWGKYDAGFDTKAMIAKVNREDLWKEAAKTLGVAAADIPASKSRGKETFFDGKVFDPENPAAYLKSLSIKRAEVLCSGPRVRARSFLKSRRHLSMTMHAMKTEATAVALPAASAPVVTMT